MEGHVEGSLIHNPALGCFLLSLFVREYQERTAGTANPGLDKLLLVLPIAWHGPSRSSVFRRNFATSLYAVIDEEPLLLDRFAERVAAYAPVTCQSVNLACATGLLVRNVKDEQTFTFAHDQWPRGAKPNDQLPAEMLGTVVRLANWFKDHSSAELYAALNVP